jgi:signal transduction histidine kinase
MPPFTHGLTYRIVATVSVALSLLFLGNHFGNYRALNAALSSNVQISISQTSQLLNTAVTATNSSPDREMRMLEVFFEEMIDRERKSGVAYVVVRDKSGATLLSAGKFGDVLASPDLPVDYEVCAAKGICHVRNRILLKRGEVGFLQYGLATQSMVAAIDEGYGISLAVTSAVTLLIFAILTLSGLGIARRLSSLSRASADIAMGNYNKRVEAFGTGELAELSSSFNRMADAIERKVRQISEFNNELETSVQQRTEELQLSNQLLEANISHLSNAREQLVKTEKLAGLGALVAGIAHELNTPIGNALVAVTTIHQRSAEFAKLVSQEKITKKALNSFVRDSLEGSELSEVSLRRAATLISSFKQVAVDQSSEWRRQFDLAKMVSEVSDTFNYAIKRSAQRLEIDIADGIGMDSYPGPLGQVVSNLINNSLIHAFEDRADGKMRVHAISTQNGRAIIEYSDNGCGIAEAHIKRIFDPFFTTRMGRGGSGLGLSIVNNIVEGLLGGTIRVESSPGHGTLFVIDIPLVAPE